MLITADNFQEEAMKFAQYNNDRRYPFGLLQSEAGEVMGKVIKLIRDKEMLLDADGNPTEEALKAIALEMGDCYWAIAAILNEVGVPFINSWLRCCSSPWLYKNSDRIASLFDLSGRLSFIANYITSLAYSSGEVLEEAEVIRTATYYCTHSLGLLKTLSEFLGDYTPELILQMNIEKLTDRKARGVISGSGDYR